MEGEWARCGKASKQRNGRDCGIFISLYAAVLLAARATLPTLASACQWFASVRTAMTSISQDQTKQLRTQHGWGVQTVGRQRLEADGEDFRRKPRRPQFAVAPTIIADQAGRGERWH